MIAGQGSFEFEGSSPAEAEPTKAPATALPLQKATDPIPLLFEVDQAPPQPSTRAKKPKTRKSYQTLWTPPEDFYLPDYPDEAANLRKRALEAETHGRNQLDLAYYVSDKAETPPLSGLVPLVRKVASRIIGRHPRYAICDSNSPSLVPICNSLLPGGTGHVTYRDAETERLGALLHGPVQPIVSGTLGNDASYDFLIRPCHMEGESIEHFYSFLTMTAMHGYALTFVSALSFMDVRMAPGVEDPSKTREAVHAGFELLSAVRFSSDPHNHKSHIDLLLFQRRGQPVSQSCHYAQTGNGFMPWQKANEFYVAQPGLIFDSRSLFSDAVTRML